ncbi:MAG: hypothetical protein GVY24_06495 [Planctomycetes bacterium]|nr:hypothetical protein [Planctomycetota bacterium]
MRGAFFILLCCVTTCPAAAEPVLWDEDGGGDDRYYEYVPGALTWNDARKAAAERRYHGVPGRLVVIRSREQNDFVHGLMPEGEQRAWIGLCDIQEEGVFVWIDGSEPTYTNWSAGEPNDAGGEDCAEMLPTGQWNDKEDDPPANSHPPQGYLVEYSAKHRLTNAGRDDAAG